MALKLFTQRPKITKYNCLNQALTFVPLGLSITNTSLQIWMPVVSRSHPPLHVNPVKGSVFPPIQQGEVYKTRKKILFNTKKGFFFSYSKYVLADFHTALSFLSKLNSNITLRIKNHNLSTVHCR